MNLQKSKIIFFGTSQFSAAILETIAKTFEVVLVITTPDKPVGRKHEISASAVAKTAEKLNLALVKLDDLKSINLMDQINSKHADLFVVVAYGKIIPKNLLDLAPSGTINIHPSLLPEFRGPSPIHAALLAGKTETGVSFMQVDEKMDHGPIFWQEKIEILPTEKFQELEEKLLTLSQKNISEQLKIYIKGSAHLVQQDDSKATFCKIIEKKDGQIDWQTSAKETFNKFRAYNLWPGVWTNWNNQILKITDCQIYQEHLNHSHNQEDIGKVYLENGNIFVPCKTGYLQILSVQLEGKNPTAIKDFLNGHPDFIGAELYVNK